MDWYPANIQQHAGKPIGDRQGNDVKLAQGTYGGWDIVVTGQEGIVLQVYGVDASYACYYLNLGECSPA